MANLSFNATEAVTVAADRISAGIHSFLGGHATWDEWLNLVLPYRFLTVLSAVNSWSLLVWYLSHFSLFVVFFTFTDPIRTSSKDRDALYAFNTMILSCLMFWMALYHAPRIPGTLHVRDMVHYFIPACAISIPVVLFLDVLLRVTVGKTLAKNKRGLLVNSLLIACTMCAQFSYCQSTTPVNMQASTSSSWDVMQGTNRTHSFGDHTQMPPWMPDAFSGAMSVAVRTCARSMAFNGTDVETSVRACIGHGSPYCHMLDEPTQLPVAVLITLLVLGLWSALFGAFLPRGIMLISTTRSKRSGCDQSPSDHLEAAAAEREVEGRKILEQHVEMCPWYTIQVLHTVFHMIIMLKVFLGRFDCRTIRSALDQKASGRRAPIDQRFTRTAQGAREELWFDFVADTGDGFDSTYTIARSLAQPHLNVEPRRGRRSLSRPRFDSNTWSVPHKKAQASRLRGTGSTASLQGSFGETVQSTHYLPRGDLLLHGGDLAYPHPSPELYEQRFFGPYEAALRPPDGADLVSVARKDAQSSSSLLATEHSSPCCWMIPGNHDWFDGLDAFLHMICGRHWIGGWHLPQTNTYWALELPHSWYVLGLDLGLTDDIDDEQFAYFHSLLEEMPAHANIITITHGPYWWLDSYYRRPSPRMYSHLLGLMRSKLRVRLAGDVHHYSRFSPKLPHVGPELVISGGGGAFLHPTHIVPEIPGYHMVETFPPRSVSRALALLNPKQFRRRNVAIEMILGVAYTMMVVAALPLCKETHEALTAWRGGHSFVGVYLVLIIRCFERIFAETITALFMQVAMLVFGCLFAEAQWGLKSRLLWGVPFGLANCLCSVAIACGCELAVAAMPNVWEEQVQPPMVLLNLSPPWDELSVQAFRSALGVVDMPAHLSGARRAVCTLEEQRAPVSRMVHFSYLLFFVPYYWVIVTPLFSFIFGTYLGLASWAGRHFDEAFSSLRIADFKNFLRMHIGTDGDLTIYAIGIDTATESWEEDPYRRGARAGAETGAGGAARTFVPSRWRPSGEPIKTKLVDTVRIPARKKGLPTQPDGVRRTLSK